VRNKYTSPNTRKDPSCSSRSANIEFAVHVADPKKNPLGGSPVVYWSVSSVGSACEQLLERGATPHRGPIEVEHRRSICQLRDPYDNIFGLDGPP